MRLRGKPQGPERSEVPPMANTVSHGARHSTTLESPKWETAVTTPCIERQESLLERGRLVRLSRFAHLAILHPANGTKVVPLGHFSEPFSVQIRSVASSPTFRARASPRR